MPRAQLLEVEQLMAGYEPATPIVNGVTLNAGGGEIVTILGPNGAGKSTLIKAIAGLVPTLGGTVRLAGEDITHLPAHRMIHSGLAFVPQTDNVFTTLTVRENLQLAAQALARGLRATRIAEAYEFFPDLARQRALQAGRLSGGQRQMLAVARALIVAPTLLLLDEPSAGLSPKVVHDLFDRLRVIRNGGVGIVLVEQNVRAALAIADRAYILAEGRNRIAGAARDLIGDPNVAALHLGGTVPAAAGS
jgi:branched-chain amino acid transport system ATP-binding protein